MIARSIALAILPVFIGAGCTKSADAPGSAVPPGPPTVALGQPQKLALKRHIEQPGQTEPIEQTPLFARVAGYVRTVAVDIGDDVKKGQLLAELSVPDLDQELMQKTALARQAAAEVDLANAAVAAADAALRSAAALAEEAKAGRARVAANAERWRSEYQRIVELSGKQVVDAQTREETQNQLKAAEAAVAEVEARVRSADAARDESAAKRDKAKADVAVAIAKRDVATADEQRTRELVGFGRLLAPFDGVVVKRSVDPGAFVQPSAMPDRPLLVVARLDTIRIFIDVPEADAGFVHKDTAVVVRVPGLKTEVTAAVSRTAGALDPKSRTLRTAIDIPNSPRKLLPGYFVNAVLTVDQRPAWTLPSPAVVRRGEATFAFRVANGKGERLTVRTGFNDGERVEIFQVQTGNGTWQDVSGGETFVVSEVFALADGQNVVLK